MAAFFTTLATGATGIPGAGLVLSAENWLNSAPLTDLGIAQLAMMRGLSALFSLVILLLAGGLALKLSLPNSFRGFSGYVRACLTSLLVGIVAMLWLAALFTMINASI